MIAQHVVQLEICKCLHVELSIRGKYFMSAMAIYHLIRTILPLVGLQSLKIVNV